MIWLLTSLGYNEGLAAFEHVMYYYVGPVFLVAMLGAIGWLIYSVFFKEVP